MENLYFTLGSMITPGLFFLFFVLITLAVSGSDDDANHLNRETQELIKRKNIERLYTHNFFN